MREKDSENAVSGELEKLILNKEGERTREREEMVGEEAEVMERGGWP